MAFNLAISGFFSCPSTLHLSRLGSGSLTRARFAARGLRARNGPTQKSRISTLPDFECKERPRGEIASSILAVLAPNGAMTAESASRPEDIDFPHPIIISFAMFFERRADFMIVLIILDLRGHPILGGFNTDPFFE
jgi:hypothetical protein